MKKITLYFSPCLGLKEKYFLPKPVGRFNDPTSSRSLERRHQCDRSNGTPGSTHIKGNITVFMLLLSCFPAVIMWEFPLKIQYCNRWRLRQFSKWMNHTDNARSMVWKVFYRLGLYFFPEWVLNPPKLTDIYTGCFFTLGLPLEVNLG